MRRLTLCFIIAISAFACSAQNVNVERIDSLCDSIDHQISDEMLLPHTISYIVNRPAIGIQRTELDFFYNAMNCENWDYDPVTDSVSYVVRTELYKVRMNYNIAASEYVCRKYYYQKDKLMFFEEVINSPQYKKEVDSLRVYYNGPSIIKSEKFVNGNSDNVTNDDIAVAEKAIDYAAEYLVFFKQMNALEYKQHY